MQATEWRHLLFEYVSQHLVFANCIPLILKFFNQNIMSYISAKNRYGQPHFNRRVPLHSPARRGAGGSSETDGEQGSQEAGDSNQFCWRNLFSCINLLRILNKLTKWKHSRTMALREQKVGKQNIDARPWDFQAEECALRESIEKFNARRYDKNQNSEFAPVDNCLQSVLGQRVELPEDFHFSYEMWLEREVFSQPIQWEELLQAQ
ncbi:hypothetical protein JZ751_005801 [Albula glossodonta]|uniref:Far11/STRP C-terminal domain-containing protein n=1 Tax=Albula glossodonta TaxID=121402 RepID=A0A8T2P311_9TELE|nr:hypothetical protein JZ751_005801 [Albula glossodonta]